MLSRVKETKESSLPVIAVDLGGSKIAVSIVSPEYQILAREHHATPARQGVDAVINCIIAAVGRIIASQGVALSQLGGISVAAAGAIDSRTGMVSLSPNLPGWHDIPLGAIIREKLGAKTWLINDANAAALGEHYLGVARGLKSLIYLAVGTGIGGAIIIAGRLYTGASGSAGEIGHMTIDVNGPRCECGNTGCLETLASGKAIAREAIRRISAGEGSSLAEIVGGRLAGITAKEVASAAQRGDALASSVLSGAAAYLGVGMVNLVNIFNPEMIVVGGGLSHLGDLLLSPARQMVRERAFPVSARAVRIVGTELGDSAGLLGAAHFAFKQELDEVSRDESS